MPEASGSADVGVDESDYSIFENKTGLGEDMKFLASMPELCDVTFLVGDTKEPICAVKAVLAARSKVFQRMFYHTASPQHKKEPPPKENKFRIFLKRSSEPLLNLQNSSQQRSGFAQQLAPIQEPDQHQTVDINEFEPDVFRQLIEYIHTGCVTLQPRTLLGLVNAADYYGLEQLRKACNGFVTCCITVDTVCALLATAERYIQYKCTKSYVQKVLEYVDDHGNEVLNLGSFTLLPQHVVCLILAREELKADEFTKFQAALMWSKKYCDNNPNQTLHNVIGTFLEYIEFHKIPANVLVKDINPLNLVPQTTIMTALAYQADPTCVDPEQLSPHRVKHHDRSLSVQSSLQDPLGSNTTLDSTVSNEGSDEKQRSGKYGTAEQETQEQRQQQWQKQREEEENLQRLIEQRSQFQSMRQEEDNINRHHEDHLTRSQEEELRKQEMQEEFERQKKRRKSEQKRMEEEAERQKMEEEAKQFEDQQNNREEEESLKFQEQQHAQQDIEQKIEDLETQQQEKNLEQQQLRKQEEDLEKQKDDIEELQKDFQQQQQDLIVKQEDDQKEQEGNEISKEEQEEAQQKEDTKEQIDEQELQQQLAEIREPSQIEPEEEFQQQLEAEAQLDEEQELQKLLEAEEQRKLREERKLQLELQELKTQLALQQELMFQKHEEALQRQIEKRRYEEESESWEFQLQQLQLEGRKPEAERRSGQRRKSKKRKSERAEIRVPEVESPKQEAPPAEGVAGFYIRLVVRQEGRANLVWLFKTHKF